MRILVAQTNPTIGDLAGNMAKIQQQIAVGRDGGADIVLFSELAICGYPPEDFLLKPHFCQAVEAQLDSVIAASKGLCVVIGTVRRTPPGVGQKFLYNTAAIISDGTLIGFQDKMLLPTYDIFDESRYFEPAETCHIWNIAGKKVAITICEDIWQHSKAVTFTSYRRDPVEELASGAPELLLNLSASPYSVGRGKTRVALCEAVAKRLRCPVVLCNQIGGNDSLIFDGNSLYLDSSGSLLAQGKGFQEDSLWLDTTATLPARSFDMDPTRDLFHALVLGLRDYFSKQNFTKGLVGLSGGIDSAVVACLAVSALGSENVLGVGMPSRFSSPGSVSDAVALAKNLGIAFREIPIEGPHQSYLDLLTPYFEGRPADATEENFQARIRGMILMALSNKLGYLVLATGNKSELAMGYSTLYGDMCGGLGVLSDVTKQQVYALARYINREKELIPLNTIVKPPSAELRPNQLDTDSLPEYAIVDVVLEDYIENNKSPQEIAQDHHYPLELVVDLVKRIHANEYKRRQAAPGLRVSQKAFSIGRRFPIVQRWV